MEAQATRAELVQTIVETLKPWRAGIARKDIKSGISEQVDLLCNVIPEHFSRGAIQKTRDDACAVKTLILNLERKLNLASPELKMRLKIDSSPGWSPPLLVQLKTARDACEQAIAPRRKNEIKEWSVRTAYRIIRKYSENEPTGTDQGPFRVIAGLVYEIVTGTREKNGKDLKRACDSHLKAIRKALDAAKVQFAD